MVPKYDSKRFHINLWDCGFQLTTQLIQSTSTQAGGLKGACPLQDVTGETPDILEYLDFGFYDYVSYKENARLGVTVIVRCIGVSHRVGKII